MRSLVFLITLIGLTISTTSLLGTKYDIKTEQTLVYIDSPPIRIMGDDDLQNQAKLYEWPGFGTVESPIIIKNLRIQDDTAQESIFLWTTTLHLRIEDCILSNGHSGIGISGSNNIVIDRLYIENIYSGIGISNSENIVINQIQIENIKGSGTGIGISDSKNVIVKNNTLMWIKIIYPTGIYLADSNNLIIQNNTITNSSTGIHLAFDTENITIMQNTITNNSIGIHTDNTGTTSNLTVLQNSIEFNHLGIALTYGKYCTILNNNFINNFSTEHGNNNIHISEGIENKIFLNNFYNASDSNIVDDGTTNTFGFNYYNYSYYKIIDADGDGYNDNVFEISGDAENTDICPLLAPATNLVELISPPLITSPLWSTPRKGVYTIEWQQSLNSLQKSITYDAYYSSNLGDTWITLAKDITQPNYAWNTTLVENGDTYKLKIIAKSSTKTCTFISHQFSVYNEPTSEPNDSKTTGLEIFMVLLTLSVLTLSVVRKRSRS